MVKIKLILFTLVIVLAGCGKKNDRPAENKSAQKDTTVVVKEEKHSGSFIFVGMIEHKPGLYRYNFATKKYEQFWSNYNEQVVELSYSPDKKSLFFLTAGHFGKKSLFPYITRVKLYQVYPDSSKVRFVKRIGDGIQVFTQWEDNNNFKVIINRIDEIVATHIYQQTYIYNVFGKEVLNEKEIFDITKSGYPRPKHKPENFNSPSGRYTLLNESKDTTQTYLVDLKKDDKYFITANEQLLNKFSWPMNEKYLVFSTVNLLADNQKAKSKVPETSTLILYNTAQHNIVKEWGGSGVKNFFICDDLLIFDNGFLDNSSITIFDLRNLQPYDEIKIKRGCGLRNIPEIPNLRS